MSLRFISLGKGRCDRSLSFCWCRGGYELSIRWHQSFRSMLQILTAAPPSHSGGTLYTLFSIPFSVICHLSSVLRLPSSVLCHLSSKHFPDPLRRPSIPKRRNDIRLPPFVARRQPSALCHPSSVICHLSSVICPSIAARNASMIPSLLLSSQSFLCALCSGSTQHYAPSTRNEARN